MRNIFYEFDEAIGTEGYYQLFRDKLFPNSTPESLDVAAFPLEGQIFRKGSLFSRVRRLRSEKIADFIAGEITKSDFYPPKASKVLIPEGRFNSPNVRTLYLADHPYVALRECGVNPGDYFLFSYIKLSTDMCLLFVKKGENAFSNLVHDLLKAEDPRFYSVINRINDDMLKFRGFHGMAYDSVKVSEGYVDSAWGTIETTKNLAISEEYIADTELAVAWLCQCDERMTIYKQSLFQRISNKKKSKLRRLDCRDDMGLFIRESEKELKKLREGSRKTARLLGVGNFSKFNSIPVKVLQK